MKKTFAVYGNCQALPIAKLLLNNETFSSQFEFVKFGRPVFMMNNNDWPYIQSVVGSVDLLITQKVGDAFGNLLSSDNLVAHTKQSAINISFPSIYFDGYFTEVDYLRGMPPTINQFCEYHDLNIVQNFLEAKSVDDAKSLSIAQITDQDFYSNMHVENGVSKSIDELKTREQNLDTHVADFIESHWQEEQLFFSINHPSRRVLLHVCDQILNLLSISDKKIPGNFEHLGGTILPVYQAVKRVMRSYQFPVVKIKGNSLPIENYVDSLLACYSKHDTEKLRQVFEQVRLKKSR